VVKGCRVDAWDPRFESLRVRSFCLIFRLVHVVHGSNSSLRKFFHLFIFLFFSYIILSSHDLSNEVFYLSMIISNSFNLLIMRKWWNAMWVKLWQNWRNVTVFGLHNGLHIQQC
jgi:hypothetical protein